MKLFTKKTLACFAAVMMLFALSAPAFAGTEATVFPEATTLDLTANGVVTLEKDGYTYDAGSKTAANGSYEVGGDIARTTSYAPAADSTDTPVEGDETPIVVTGGGEVYLTLNAVQYDLFCYQKDAIGFITVTDNTTLHLTWVGGNLLAISGNTSTLDAMIEVESGSKVILEGGTAEEDELTIDVSESWQVACIGASMGAEGAIVKGGTVIVESGNLNLFGGYQANCIGGTHYAYLEKIVINGGNLYGEGRQAASPVIGVGRYCGTTDCEIEINGGNVEAMQRNGSNFGFCAIIGGCGTATMKSIVINGGNVLAYVQPGTQEVFGANGVCGIGGGQTIAGGTVTINGGEVYVDVSAAYNGTAIGAAQGGSVTNITINGGKITAIGKGMGTAIGGSRDGVGGTRVVINGGVIDAGVVAGSSDIIGSAGGAGVVKVQVGPAASIRGIYTSFPEIVISMDDIEDADENYLYVTAVEMPEDFTPDCEITVNGVKTKLGAEHTYFASIYEMITMDEETLEETQNKLGQAYGYYYFYLPEEEEVTISFAANGKEYSTTFTVTEPEEDDDLNLIPQLIEAADWSSKTVATTTTGDNTVTTTTTVAGGNTDDDGNDSNSGNESNDNPNTGAYAPMSLALVAVAAAVVVLGSKSKKTR